MLNYNLTGTLMYAKYHISLFPSTLHKVFILATDKGQGNTALGAGDAAAAPAESTGWRRTGRSCS